MKRDDVVSETITSLLCSFIIGFYIFFAVQ